MSFASSYLKNLAALFVAAMTVTVASAQQFETESGSGEAEAGEPDPPIEEPAPPEVKDDATTTVTISVIDATTGGSVHGAGVFIVPGPGNDKLIRRADMTNDGGICKVVDLPNGKIAIVVSAEGMKTFKQQYNLTGAGQNERKISIELTPDEEGE